jgi:hypothetical protein
LDTLLAQINALAPQRSKASDGSIGDAAHQAGTSEHNPEYKPGPELDEVDARDFTHDPRNGADMDVFAESLRLSRDWRIKYVIWNRRQFSPRTGWKWVAYSGSNPHDKHMHVSVNDVDDDNTTPWRLDLAGGTPRAAVPSGTTRRGTKVTLYHKAGSSPGLYALAGDSPGTPANWLETTDYNGLAVPWALVHGNSIALYGATWDDFKGRYTAPLRLAVGPATSTAATP